MRVHTTLLSITISLALLSCSKGGSGGGGGEGGEVTTAGTTGGVTGSGGTNKTSTGQLVVDKGSPTATEVNAQQLNLPPGVKPAGPAVSVSDSKNYNAGQIVIAIPYESQGAGLWGLAAAEDTSRIVVIYHVKNKDGTFTLGLIPNPELEFAESLVSFTSHGAGNYQAAYLPEPVTKPITKIVDTPVLSAEEESQLSIVVWSKLTGEATADRKFKISGAVSNADVVLKRCVVIIDEDKAYPYDQAIYVSANLTSEHVVAKDTAHDLYGRLECQDNYGRSVTSAWTEKVSVPQAKYASASLLLASSGVVSDGYINASEAASNDPWLNAVFADQIEVKYTAWLTSPISYTCASSLDYSLSAAPTLADLPGDGVYWVCAKVTSVHNKISYEHTQQLTKDTIAPAVDAGVDVLTNAAKAMAPAVTGAVSYLWSGAGVTITNPTSLAATVSATGGVATYTLTLTATDAAGNSASDTVQFTWDQDPPVIDSFTANEGDGMVNIADKAGKSGPLFTISISGDVTYTKYSNWVTTATNCSSLAIGSFTNAATPTYASLASDFANRKICVRVADNAGNVVFATSPTLSVDLSAPTLSLTGITPADASTNNNVLSFSTSGSSTSYEYFFGDQLTPCANVSSWTGPVAIPTTSPALPDGSSRLCVRGLEASGNVSAIVTYDWLIDATPPVPGNNGSIVIGDLSFMPPQGQMSYAWNAAVDGVSAQGALQYSVYMSANSNDSIAALESTATLLTTATGGTGVIPKTQSTLLTAQGLLQYLYVVVVDAVGNKALYTPRSIRVPNQDNRIFTQMSVGSTTGCGLDQEGYAFCWGSNSSGTFGIGSTGGTNHVPQRVSGARRYKKISSGSNSVCAIDENSDAYCWGGNTFGQVGDSTNTSRNSPTAVSGGLKFRDISVGTLFACGVTLNGSAYCWGYNNFSQLGDNSQTASSAPVAVQIEGGGSKKFVSVITGKQNSCAIDENHDLYCWGDNSSFQVSSTGAQVTEAKLVSLGASKAKSAAIIDSTVCAVATSGRAMCRGANDVGLGLLGRNDTVSPNSDMMADVVNLGGLPLENVDTISGTYQTLCARTASSDVYCWGNNNSELFGGASPASSAYAHQLVMGAKVATQLSVGATTACALDADGDVHCWGLNTNKLAGSFSGSIVGQTQLDFSQLKALTRFASIATGANHSCALTGQGNPHCWGDRANGKLGDGGAVSGMEKEPVAVSGAFKFTRIAVGSQHSCALNSLGAIYCWGDNAYGQLGYSGADSTIPLAVASPDKFIGLSLGEFHSCALAASGMVKCWGRNNSGQLGDGSSNNSSSPVGPAGTFLSVAAGKNHTCGIGADGQGYCWGDNTYYQLANATPSLSPVAIDGGNRMIKLAVGDNHACALRGDGIPVCWGDNRADQVGNSFVGTEAQAPFAVSGSASNDVGAGANHSCILKSDNAINCWGKGDAGQLGRGDYTNQNMMGTIVGPSYAKARSLSIGGNGSCAVLLDGSSYCWGDDSLGQLGDMLGGTMQNVPSRVSEFFTP